MKSMFGFTCIGERSDHAIAGFLRRHGAINDCTKRANSNQWRNEAGVVLIGFYTGNTTCTYWVPDALAPAGKRLKKPIST